MTKGGHKCKVYFMCQALTFVVKIKSHKMLKVLDYTHTHTHTHINKCSLYCCSNNTLQ